MTNVIEVLNPRALMVPEVQQLLFNAMQAVEIAAPYGFNSVAEALYQQVVSPNMFMVMGFENGDPKSVALGFFPTSALFPYPTVSLMYNEGNRRTARETQEKVMEIIAGRGYDKAWAFNASGKRDDVWIRGMVPDGVEGSVIGSVVQMRKEK